MGSCVSSNYKDSSGFKDKANGPSRVLGSKVNGYKNLSHQEEKSNNLSILSGSGPVLSSSAPVAVSPSSTPSATAAASSAKFNNSSSSNGISVLRSAGATGSAAITSSSTPSHHADRVTGSSSSSCSASERALHHSSSTNSSNNQTIVIALYTYNAKDDGDLSFKKGERLLVLDDRDPDWWLAKSLSKNERGYIPRNYVVSEQLETEEYVYHHTVTLCVCFPFFVVVGSCFLLMPKTDTFPALFSPACPVHCLIRTAASSRLLTSHASSINYAAHFSPVFLDSAP